MRLVIIVTTVCISLSVRSQTVPSFGPEIEVAITGLTFDAMEPFISSNSEILFFNSLNDGVNTKLYYATKINDSTFNFTGEVNGANQITPPHLDAVADMDSMDNFYWTSTRNYPNELDNLFHGTFNNGSVSSIGRVHGDFNKNTPGWLVMDHGITLNGQYLYYNNARFDGVCQGPCETEIGIAQKANDSTFNQISNSSFILQNINNPNFNYYAPCISSDDLELYYTRFPRDTVTTNTLFEICVAVRNSPTDMFSIPTVLFSELIASLIEAPTLTTDKQIIYYHKKIGGTHRIVMRYKQTNPNHVKWIDLDIPISVYPIPTNDVIRVKTNVKYENIKLTVSNLSGVEVISVQNQSHIDLSSVNSGTYLLTIELDGVVHSKKIVKMQ